MPKKAYSTVRREVLARMEKAPTRGKIAELSPQRRDEMHRDIGSKRLTLQQIADKYGLSKNSVVEYRDRRVRPAMAMAAQNDALDTGRTALGAMWEIKDAAMSVAHDLRMDPAADSRKLGNVEQLLGRAHDAVRSIGEMTGELPTKGMASGSPTNNTVIQVISIPKIPGTPTHAPVDGETAMDYSGVKLIDVSPEPDNETA